MSGRVSETINSGQVFLWERRDGFWFGIDGQDVIRIPDGALEPESIRGHERYFRLDDDTDGILKEICRDGTVREAAGRFPGLRLLRQDPFQCYVSFIASSNSSIQNIRSSLRRMCGRYGRRTELYGREFALFPTPDALARLEPAELAQCGLGYRTRFVIQAARDVLDGRVDFDLLRRSGYGTARDVLLGTPGIGDKVADCILLFSLDKLEAFPLDRWVIRVLERHYPGVFPLDGGITPRRYRRIHEAAVGHFGRYAGYAQQFLFKLERESHGRGWL